MDEENIMYKPPFTITNYMLNTSIEIAQKVEKINAYQSLKRMPILRRNNRIKSIHSSLAIEANSLSLDQVRDVIDGNPVTGSKLEIDEVKDAYEAYKIIEEYNCYKEKDLLRAHSIIARSIDSECGRYRSHPEGVFDESGKVIHIAPSEKMAPQLMSDLFEWLKNDKSAPLLIKSCIFHYEFVFIHPFGDGNGRTARLWQNVLLMKWNNLFEYIPIESHIHKFQADYYKSIAESNKNGNSVAFVEFMLKMINETLDDVLNTLGQETKNVSEQMYKLLEVMEKDIPYSANELMRRLGIKSKETLRNSYLNSAIENGLVKLTIPDKPNSKNQKYYK